MDLHSNQIEDEQILYSLFIWFKWKQIQSIRFEEHTLSMHSFLKTQKLMIQPILIAQQL